jgi:UDP-N-acetylglucosamine 2-epimerase (non-hydrolysing)
MSQTARPCTVHLVSGARPNFMKVAPLFHALSGQSWCNPVLVHTGQHFDANMSDTIWRDLKLPKAHVALDAGRGSHAEQTASVMVAYERACLAERPDWTVVVGDVNSTLACALTAKKISDLLWTPSIDADENLRREGIAASRIERVGNIMIDSLEMLGSSIQRDGIVERLHLDGTLYGLVTLHRPSNVDDGARLRETIEALIRCSEDLRLVFPVHPRTTLKLREADLDGMLANSANIMRIEPIGYISFMALIRGAALVITDSGGIQEETSYLGIPCLTLRENTERPITLKLGTNQLAKPTQLAKLTRSILKGKRPNGNKIDLWDGLTAVRVFAASYARNSPLTPQAVSAPALRLLDWLQHLDR